MLVLVSNLGSTSFKFKLFDMPSEKVLATGSADRVGTDRGSSFAFKSPQFETQHQDGIVNHSVAIDLTLAALVKGGIIKSADEIKAVGFKAVHGGPISGAVVVDDNVLSTMEQFSDVAPAHNPPYIAAMKAFAQKLLGVPQVAAFETAFHQTIPAARQIYAIPHEWTEKLGIRRYGFHGASHRYIATRVPELVGGENCRRLISCHLGGSSSIAAIEDGKCIATTFGMTAQSGLPQNNRVGDFDTFALHKLLKQGMSLDEIFRRLGKEGGLFGMSGISNDMRDIEKAAAEGNARAKLAIDAYVEAIRGYLGNYLVALGGCDVLAFTGGIGENGIDLRAAICRNMEWLGIELDATRNQTRSKETKISTGASRTQIWIVPTNEELIVARQTVGVLGRK